MTVVDVQEKTDCIKGIFSTFARSSLSLLMGFCLQTNQYIWMNLKWIILVHLYALSHNICLLSQTDPTATSHLSKNWEILGHETGKYWLMKKFHLIHNKCTLRTLKTPIEREWTGWTAVSHLWRNQINQASVMVEYLQKTYFLSLSGFTQKNTSSSALNRHGTSISNCENWYLTDR